MADYPVGRQFSTFQLPLFTSLLLSLVLQSAAQDASTTTDGLVALTNPSFEDRLLLKKDEDLLKQQGFLALPAGSTAVPGWGIGGGGVRLYYDKANVTVVAQGSAALALANQGPGSITQTLTTTPGRTYDISWAVVGAGFGCTGRTFYEVLAGNTALSFFQSPPADGSPGTFLFLSFSFTADASGLLTFKTNSTSAPHSFCAVVLDAITVRARPDIVAVPGDLVANGGFEQGPSFPSGQFHETRGLTYVTFLFGNNPLLGWGIARGNTGAWLLRTSNESAPVSGSYSMGFLSTAQGFYQTLSTRVGQRYKLSFNTSGIIDTCEETYTIVAYLGSTSATFIFRSDETKWLTMEATAFSTSTTLMLFSTVPTATNATSSICAPLVDQISVVKTAPTSPTTVPAPKFGNFTGQAEELNIAIPRFLNASDLVLLGSPLLENDTTTGAPKLTLTRKVLPESGRALFREPFRLFDRAMGRTAWFETNFTFAMSIARKSTALGDQGLTFLLVPDAVEKGVPGGGLAFEYPPDNNGTRTPTFAVEFDTYQNPAYGDINGDYEEGLATEFAHHVGLDVVTAASLTAVDLKSVKAPARLNSGVLFYCYIRFDNSSQNVTVWLSDTQLDGALPAPILETTIDLNTLLGPAEWFYVGFSASTDVNLQSHEIYSWTFQSSISSGPPQSQEGTPGGAPARPPTQNKKKSGSNAGAIGGATGAALFFLMVCACAIAAFCIRRKRKAKEDATSGVVAATGTAVPRMLTKSATTEALGIPMGPQPFTFAELQSATNNFSTKLGQGGQGSVYMGTLPDGQSVAVKVIDIEKNAKDGERVFRAEASTLGSLRHRNICRLVGWCVDLERAKLMCCYEYMPNGSLNMWLFPPREDDRNQSTKDPLSWSARHGIALGLARALTYLHEEAEHKVIHRDVKPGNIMLDETFNARLGDFGLAFAVKHDVTTMESRTVAGTFGYLPPEAGYGFKANEKWDVYAFGLVALEIVSGRKAVDVKLGPNDAVLLMHAWQLYEENRPLDLADKRMQGQFNAVQMLKLIRIALACTTPNPQTRPNMWQVVQALVVEGESIHPVEFPTVRPAELVVPDYVSNASSSSWSATPVLGANFSGNALDTTTSTSTG